MSLSCDWSYSHIWSVKWSWIIFILTFILNFQFVSQCFWSGLKLLIISYLRDEICISAALLAVFSNFDRCSWTLVRLAITMSASSCCWIWTVWSSDSWVLLGSLAIWFKISSFFDSTSEPSRGSSKSGVLLPESNYFIFNCFAGSGDSYLGGLYSDTVRVPQGDSEFDLIDTAGVST
jgi:hypothetical protein